MTEKQSWSDRLFGGFRKTSEKLTSNLTEVVGTAKLDDATLDDVEDAWSARQSSTMPRSTTSRTR